MTTIFITKIQSWLNENDHHFSVHTRLAYQSDAYDFFTFLNAHKPEISTLEALNEHLMVQDIRSWLTRRLGEDLTHRSNARALSALKSFFKYLCDEKLIQHNMFTRLRAARIANTLPRPLSEESALNLIETIHTLSTLQWLGMRDRALFSLIYSVGLRINEALQLTQGDVLEEAILIMGKGRKQRHVPLIPIVKSYIEAYLKVCPHTKGPDCPLFFSVRGKALSASGAAKIIAHFRRLNQLPSSVTPHALRHSCATHLVSATSDLRGVQELLGHASLSTTQIYVDVDNENLIKNYNKFKPRS